MREKNVIAHGVPPGAGGKRRVRTAWSRPWPRSTRTGRGSGRRHHPTRRTKAEPLPAGRIRHGRSGKVRPARLTDLSRSASCRDLPRPMAPGCVFTGAAAGGPAIGVFTPSGSAARVPAACYVHEPTTSGRSASSVTALVTSGGRSWSSTRGVGRRRRHGTGWCRRASATAPSVGPPASTSPAPTSTATWSCSTQAGFMRYGDELVLFRPSSVPFPSRLPR